MQKLTASEKIEFANFHEEYLSRYIALADAKAGVAITIDAGLLGFIATRSEWWIASKSSFAWLGALVLNGALPLVGGAVLLWVIAPRPSSSSEGTIFWRSVRAHPDEASYIDRISNMSEDDLSRERLSHSWALSGIAQKKYNHLYIGLVFTVFAALFTAAHLVTAELLTSKTKANDTPHANHAPTAVKQATGPIKPASAAPRIAQGGEREKSTQDKPGIAPVKTPAELGVHH